MSLWAGCVAGTLTLSSRGGVVSLGDTHLDRMFGTKVSKVASTPLAAVSFTIWIIFAKITRASIVTNTSLR